MRRSTVQRLSLKLAFPVSGFEKASSLSKKPRFEPESPIFNIPVPRTINAK
jgi:hypothetical protein